MGIPTLLVFKVNIGLLDRAIRIILGVVLLANLAGRFGGSYLLNLGDIGNLALAFFGLIVIITAALGHSPLYSYLNFNTIK